MGPELSAALDRVLRSGQFILGTEVAAFESEFATYCGTRYARAVASGTDALQLALAGAGITPGDEVIVPTVTSGATATAIVRAGGRPIFVDVDSRTLTLSVDDTARHVSPRTRAIVPVHLYGHPADVEPLLEIASQHNIPLIEDACQAHGARVGLRRVGALGLAGCFSFYPSKNLGAYGDGGMITTDSEELANRVQLLRQYGWQRRDFAEILGFNSRLDEIQAALLRCKLPYLDTWNERRRQIAHEYNIRLAELAGVQLPIFDAGDVFHLFVVRVPKRDKVREGLTERGIDTGIHYASPLHRQPAFSAFVGSGRSFPNAEAACSEILSLPMFPQLRIEEVDMVVRALRAELES